MALTTAEEAMVRQLLDQQAAILSLAGNEPTITSKLGATKVTLSDLVAATSLGATDLVLVRQGVDDKTATPTKFAEYVQSVIGDGGVPACVGAGTADAITATFTPPFTTYSNGDLMVVTGLAANTVVNPTLNADGLGAKTIKLQNGEALMIGDMPPNAIFQFSSAFDAFILVNPLVETANPVITSTDNANARTFTLQPCVLTFRNSASAGGPRVKRRVPNAITLTLSAGSTLGSAAGRPIDIMVGAIDNAGVVELIAKNYAGANNSSEQGLISTTAEGGAGAADSKDVWYSTTARSNVPHRILYINTSTQATAGTWVTAPSLHQAITPAKLGSMRSLGVGQSWQSVTRTNGVTYWNDTDQPIELMASMAAGSGANQYTYIQISPPGGPAGPNMFFIAAITVSSVTFGGNSITIPPGHSYVITGFSVSVSFYELR